jgi:hypothetical protein
MAQGKGRTARQGEAEKGKKEDMKARGTFLTMSILA